MPALPMLADPRRLLHPSTILIVASNLIPIVGVLYWRWDMFLVLMLFWMETAVIAFWTMAGILTLAPAGGILATHRASRILFRVFVVVFFTVHAGLFMLVHLLFLWTMFSGEWHAGGVGTFIARGLIGSGLWIALAVSFVGRGIDYAVERAAGRSIRSVGAVVAGLYGRIVAMHLTILLGAWLAQAYGSLAPLLLLVGLKTVIDVAFHISVGTGTLRAAR